MTMCQPLRKKLLKQRENRSERNDDGGGQGLRADETDVGREVRERDGILATSHTGQQGEQLHGSTTVKFQGGS